MRKAIFLTAVTAALLTAQTTTARRVRVFGDATVAVRPDQGKISIGVETQATTAQDATAQNATKAQAVFDQLKALIGATGDIKTTSFYVSPVAGPYIQGQPQTIIGYRAINTIEVTTSDMGLVGKVVDTAVQAGANRVDSLQLGLKDDDPVRNQALRAAGQRARLRAEAIAAGLGIRLGAVAYAEEGTSYRPLTRDTGVATGAAATPATPVQSGTLDVVGTITVEYEIAP